jgi:hypothetical protein
MYIPCTEFSTILSDLSPFTWPEDILVNKEAKGYFMEVRDIPAALFENESTNRKMNMTMGCTVLTRKAYHE